MPLGTSGAMTDPSTLAGMTRNRRRTPWAGAILVAGAVLFTVDVAGADFRICNNTGSRVGLAVGYKDTEHWTTEGWWNLSARTCETILRGQLVARYYYVYAVDYDRSGFFEVDTGEQPSWTVQLTDSADQAPQQPLQSRVPVMPTPSTTGR